MKLTSQIIGHAVYVKWRDTRHKMSNKHSNVQSKDD